MSDPATIAQRLPSLARLLQADALALATTNGHELTPLASWGVDGRWLDGPAGMLAGTALQMQSIQHRPDLSVPLADGRSAIAALAAPVRANDTGTVVVAFRSAEPFLRSDAGPMSALADLLGQELRPSADTRRSDEWEARAQRAEVDRAHAIVLYEVARSAAYTEDREAALERSASVVRDGLGVDLSAIRLVDGEGYLRCAAGRGYLGTPARMRMDADQTLVRVALGQRVESAHFKGDEAPPWSGGASDMLVAPIVLRGSVRGIFVQGRLGGTYSTAERELSALIAETVAPLAAMATGGGGAFAPAGAPAPSSPPAAYTPAAAPLPPVPEAAASRAAPAAKRSSGGGFALLLLLLAIASAAGG
ncbi:MAG: hypothetical protein FJ034_09170 [Chloroflexi bacterium]|nr:hypothetical protein [Chloroflexota bacterium]